MQTNPTKTNQLSYSNLCKPAFICGCFSLLLISIAMIAGQATSLSPIQLQAGSLQYFMRIAQRGGKAEPNRIEFKRGTASTTISNTVRGDEEAEYVLAAKKGQRLVIKLTSAPAKSSVFQILGPENDTLGLEFGANYNYSGVLPATGDYFISVKRSTTAKGRSRYRLTITIR